MSLLCQHTHQNVALLHKYKLKDLQIYKYPHFVTSI